jgi:eukaryotic-like serine/threonine-protein kinase
VEAVLSGDADADDRLQRRESATGPEDPASASHGATPESPDPFGLRGSTVSHFRLLDVLGAGGMGVVYRAEDVRLGRTVALKFLLPQFSVDPQAKARFLREAQAAGRLDHPNLCTVFETGETDQGHLFLAMAYYPGETLKARLARDGTVPLARAIDITAQIARGLAYAHDAGVVHRDLKPANLMITPDGTIRILDFGLAKARDLLTLTETGVGMGTLAYMSPEQLSGDRVDARTDLWSLGVVLVEMLTGRPPPRGRSPARAMRDDDAQTDGSGVRQPDEVPETVVRVAEKLLRDDPAERYQSARELLSDLGAERAPGDDALVGASPQDRPVSPPSRVERQLPGVESRSRGGVLNSRRLSLFTYPVIALLVVVLGATIFWFLKRERDRHWLVDETIPRMEQQLDVADWESAFALARQAEARVPGSRELAEFWPRMSWRVTIRSEPAGAMVFRQAYGRAGDRWEELGRTPLVDIRIPYGLSRLRLELDGYRPLMRALGGGHLNWEELTPADPDMLLVGPERYKLDSEKTLPAGMVRVSEWRFVDGRDTLAMRDFFLGRYEVTNAEFKAFVDAGGYRQPGLWDPIVVKRRTAPFEEAMARFVDRTGQAGPSTWEGGDYPEGEGDFPVSGVSWYEAAAYARFVRRALPTAHHWQQALANAMFPWLLPASNFTGKGPRRVSESRAMSQYGAFDMTGNVREWTSTAIGDERIILGGSWNDPYYIAGTNDTSAPADDRSAGNGIRLAMMQDEPAIAARISAPIAARTTTAQVVRQAPVADPIYAAYSRVFDYDRGPLDPSIEDVDTTRVWIRQRIQFNAGYGNERMLLHLYVPTAATPPYQAVVYWPGWDTFFLDDIDEYFAKQVDFIVKSGRAVAFPIYRGTLARRIGNQRTRPMFGTAEYRDNAIYGVKDLRRTIDYLETRRDVDRDAIAFFGYSWGGVNGPVAMAQEPRIRVGVIQIGLLPPMEATPEVDPINALPRVNVPILMFSGEFDPMVPAENARRYFELIGSPPTKKRHVMAVGGHFIPRDLLIRETLAWLDAYLGRVSR